MPKLNSIFNLIIPAREIVEDHSPTDILLSTFDTSTRDLIELFLNAWADHKSFLGQVDELPISALCNLNARWVVMDVIFDVMEKRIELGESRKPPPEDVAAVETVMLSIWDSLRTYIFTLLNDLKISEYQIAHLRFVRWVDNDFIISFPRHSPHLQVAGWLDQLPVNSGS